MKKIFTAYPFKIDKEGFLSVFDEPKKVLFDVEDVCIAEELAEGFVLLDFSEDVVIVVEAKLEDFLYDEDIEI